MEFGIDVGVTPCVGVWIETSIKSSWERAILVTPCVGVWIETPKIMFIKPPTLVTPCVGVWIETYTIEYMFWRYYSHTLRGCVD